MHENAGTLGMVPLRINPIYTLYSGYLLGIYTVYPLLKGSNRGVKQLGYHPKGPPAFSLWLPLCWPVTNRRFFSWRKTGIHCSRKDWIFPRCQESCHHQLPVQVQVHGGWKVKKPVVHGIYLEDHPRHRKWLITMVIVSPLSRVIPLPNGLNGL